MIIELRDLPKEGRRFRGEEPASIVDLPEGSLERVEGPIRYDLTVQCVSDELIVRGRLWAHIAFACARCLKSCGLDVEDPEFERCYDLREEGVPWVEKGESVDLTPDMREATILTLPAYPVCRQECLGLCPRCGADLNRGRCGCQPEQDVRWNVLDKFRT